MRKDLIFLIAMLIGLMLITLTWRADFYLLLVLFVFILGSYIVLFFVFAFKRNKKIIKNFQKSYLLEVLDNVIDDIYVLKKYTSNNGFIYYFSYVNENGKKVTRLESNVEIKRTIREPYVEIYKNIYKPKGFLDFLFYSKDIAEYDSVIYVLYVNDNMIKSAN